MTKQEFNRKVRSMFRQMLDDDELHDLRSEAVAIAEVLRDDDDAVAYILEQHLPVLVEQIGQAMLRADQRLTRPARRLERATPRARVVPEPPASEPAPARMIRLGSMTGNITAMKRQIAEDGAVMSAWKWKEFVPTQRIEIELPLMTRDDLLAAAEYRHRKAAENVHNSVFLREIAERMAGKQQVRDVWDDRSLTVLWRGITAVETFSTHSVDDQPAPELASGVA